MKTRRHCIMILMVSVVLAGVCFLFAAEEGSAADCRVIRVYAADAQGTGTVRIEPSATAVNKGTCVIWANLGRGGEMKITFNEGKACSDASESAHGFSMADTCFVTTWLPMGATSSLTFQESGTYKYEVEWKGTTAKDSGMIIVQ